MNHTDHVALLQRGVTRQGGVWADLGAGTGAFTLALAELLGHEGALYAVDRDRGALERLARAVYARFPKQNLQLLPGDFMRPLNLPLLDGIVMANSLHFVERKPDVLAQVRSYLRPGGRLIVVEYNTDRGNRWVPFPFSFITWQRLAAEAGFEHTMLLATHPSSFLGEFYSAASCWHPPNNTAGIIGEITPQVR
ncbi:MAG: class I SAM-dependent methyltransferase [Caldilinea sp.]